MSLKRYALLSAISYHNSQNGNTQKNESVQVMAATTTTTVLPHISNLANAEATTTNASAQQRMDFNLPTTTTASSTTAASTTTTTTTTTASTFTTYNGGIGLYHQQTSRGVSNNNNIILYANSIGNNGVGSGASGNGHGYPNGNFYMNGNVNLLLGGAMLSLITTILCVVCYCCHRNIKKRTEAAYRQQRQWLDNDPNMEIYSVEQCYETSGLFISESTDGLATIPALHHEPPPSYDAVVAMQQEQQLLQQQQQHQQQQQQLLLQQQLQRASPPPGYRSSLDVSNIVGAMASAHSAGRGTPDGMAASSEGNSVSQSNLSNLGNNSMTIAHHKQQQANAATSNGNAQRANPMNQQLLRKVLNAQSCCSLQRAEVENMWNAAAAAVASRAQHTQHAAHACVAGDSSSNTTTAAASELNTLTPQLFPPRKSLPAAGKLSVQEFGRRYLNQNYYRRGCPLCGKFRYNDADDATLSLSTESGLDNPMPAAATHSDTRNNNNEQCEQTIAMNCRRSSIANTADMNDNNCIGCSRSSSSGSTLSNAMTTGSSMAARSANNGNDCAAMRSQQQTAACCEYKAKEQAAAAADHENGNSISAEAATANDMPILEQQQGTYAFISDELFNSNDNGNTDSQLMAANAEAITSSPATSTATACQRQVAGVNGNSLANLDISKIIDNTGLPTYDGAMKLESSGYV